MSTTLLLATLAALLSGPLLYALAQRRPALLSFLDGFVLVSITGLVLIDVLPEALATGGLASVGFLAAGLLGPTLLEQGLARARRETHLLTLGLAIAGLVLHSVGDGTALSGSEHGSHGTALGLAVAIHSIPVGLVVWWLLYPVFGAPLPTLALLAMCAATLAGYVFGVSLGAWLGLQGWAWLQALIAGSILHVIFGRPHLDETAGHHAPIPPLEGFGNLAALATLAWIALAHAPVTPPAFFQRLLHLSLESAPALLLAYAAGGIIGGELPQRWLGWIRRGSYAVQALRGMAVGLPLPVCSCGVLPLYRSLIGRGVPLAAALAFLIATPEIGLTALFVSLPLLGLEMTLIRIAAAGVLAVAVAWLVVRCAGTPQALPHAPVNCPHCGTPASLPSSRPARVRRALRYGFVDLVDDTVAWILAGLVLAAAVLPYVGPLFQSGLPDTLEVILFALLGLPVYVCAAGATPLVAVLIAGGVSPGAGLAFLLTGPATNVSTFGVLHTLHGPRLALGFAACMTTGAVLIGLIVNAVVSDELIAQIPAAHRHSPALYEWVSLSILGLLYAAALLRKGARALVAGLFAVRHVAAT